MLLINVSTPTKVSEQLLWKEERMSKQVSVNSLFQCKRLHLDFVAYYFKLPSSSGRNAEKCALLILFATFKVLTHNSLDRRIGPVAHLSLSVSLSALRCLYL